MRSLPLELQRNLYDSLVRAHNALDDARDPCPECGWEGMARRRIAFDANIVGELAALLRKVEEAMKEELPCPDCQDEPCINHVRL